MFKNRSAAQNSKRLLSSLIQPSCIFLLSAAVLMACSGGQSTPPGTTSQTGASSSSGSESSLADKSSAKKSDAAGSEDESDDMDDSANKRKPKKTHVIDPETLEGKKTGVMEDTVVVQQQNEFLGASVLKLSKAGIRLESPTLIIIMPPGKEAVAYNPQNGNCIMLTAKSRTLLSGNSNFDEGKQESKKVASEKIAGLNCIHYKLTKYLIDPKTKQKFNGWESDLWATNDLKLSKATMNDCARITMMPVDLGFPVKIVRAGNTTRTEKNKGIKSKTLAREVVSTNSFKHEKIDRGQFALLAGFKTVKDEMQLMMSGDEEELAGGSGLDDIDKEPVR